MFKSEYVDFIKFNNSDARTNLLMWKIKFSFTKDILRKT